ncbi:type II toxin-antitoxin system RatA family toxin [Pseudoruegeria sp. HB172150]|uniref:type II toxin-antitoxin system RatA family toxin n=1 Tax=Pseudoruegeria sp. HB172150 TaxID=2721164 RepID=UPI001556C7A1|nr:type II toxin-antitoxin system RatA family toxin [Pseudoruegeria sp. HB172150]
MTAHSETRRLPYSARQMYDLVADVEKYPEFLPWCAAARVNKLVDTDYGRLMEADLVISFKVFREKFGSRVELHDEELKIVTEYIDGPFKYLKSVWNFRDLDEGCEVAFDVDFEFRNMILQRAIGLVFNQAMHRIVAAFENRANALHG